MPSFKDYDIWGLLSFVIPGMIIYQSYFLARDWSLKGIGKDDLLPYAMITAIYAISLWYLGYALQSASSISGLERGLLVRIYLFWPVLLGLAAGTFVRYDAGRRFLRALGVPVPDPDPPIRTPWPVVIPTITKGTYMTIVLKDGAAYNVLVTDDSQFSSDPANIDLYFGQTFSREDWSPSTPQRAVYIRGSEIRAIEIIRS